MYRTGLSNTLRLDLKHGAGEGPVAGEVDEVEDDAQPHGDAQQRAVAPPASRLNIVRAFKSIFCSNRKVPPGILAQYDPRPGVVEGVRRCELGPDPTWAIALHPSPGPVVEQRHWDSSELT